MSKLTDISYVKGVLAKHGFTFSKALGQNFLINPSVCPKMAEMCGCNENVGVIEPLIVVKNGERYNILSGRHRFRACQKLGKSEIPCYIKDTDETTARYILIATNTDRNAACLAQTHS